MTKKIILSGVAVALVGTFLATPALAQRRATRAARPVAEPPAISSTSSAERQVLPLKRVVLYSNGVAYFERRGTVTGRAEIALDFKQSQIDDVLKSMLVLDLGKGRIESVSYNTSLPAEARLDEIPFAVDAAEPSGLAAVLKKLQGTRVAVTGGTKTVTGAVLTVEDRQESDAGPSKEKAGKPIRHLVITGDDGELASFDLSDIRSLKVIDGDTRRDIKMFTEAKSAERRRESKTIVVTSEGTGTRELVVSYTIAAPIWKTSYRVVLDKAGKPFFQGWAIVDNVSEEDWNGVALSLVSGDPTSFIQPLQQPMFKYREVKELPEGVELLPQTFDVQSGRGVPGGTPGGGYGGAVGASGDAAPPPPPDAPSLAVAPKVMESGYAGTSIADLGEAIRTGDAGVATAAEGVEAGDLFEYRVGQPVTVARNRSALIPIVQKEMNGERVSLFDARSGGERPRNGFFVENTSGLTLENGPLTVIDGDSYGGEGELERLKPKEKRFIGFGTDLATKVTKKTERTKDPVALVRVKGGRFETFYAVKDQTTFTIVNQTDRPRTLFLDFPMPDKWKFSDEVPKPESVENGMARFRIELAPREVKAFPVTLTLMLADIYELTNLTARDLELFVNRKYLDEPSKTLFDRILEIKARRDAAGNRIQRAEEEIRTIETDQKRLRENITALGGKAEAKQLIARYVAKADAQESQLEKLRGDADQARVDRAAAQNELDTLIRTIAFERPLK
jgi:hypothetical protein